MKAQPNWKATTSAARPPYGYRQADASPHPNPAKATEGRGLHQPNLDPITAPIAQRIFTAGLTACDKKLASYRAALDASADPTVVTAWITETQNERRCLQELLAVPRPEPRTRLTHDQISAIVQQVGELTTALAEADPVDRAEVYRQLGLKLIYHPEQQGPRTGSA